MDVLTVYPVTTYFFIFPGTFQSCSSVSFMEELLTSVPVVGCFNFNMLSIATQQMSSFRGW
jgi:hypothetical protein